MKRKIAAILTALTLALPLAACGEGEETTLSGMVVSVDGTVIQLVEMDESNLSNMGGADRAEGERPQMPEGMEGFQGFGGFNGEGFEGFDGEGFENFNPEDFQGMMPGGGNFSPWGDGERPEGATMPEDGNFPQWGSGERPEGGNFPQWDGERPEGGNFPQWDGERPEGMTLPEGETMPDFGGSRGQMDFESMIGDTETKSLDLANAHISIEIEGGKEGGSLEDVQPGCFVTVTVNGKGEATYVLITSQMRFGGNRGTKA